MEQKFKVVYNITAKNVNEAIDAKNKILANTLPNEEVKIRIEIPREF